ncbi:MAG: multifunctional CCA tRNA nucleotidyl transferase/2'3'-cyclic phosphodiesterase/2'nucleotidase/phosphatase [Betaproteobacteria bacterium]
MIVGQIESMALQAICDRLKQDPYCQAIAPARVYCVGGAVRDLLLGREVHDHDWLVVGSSPQHMLEAGFLPVGRDFPVFLHPQNQEEFALARTERKIAGGYQGFAFYCAPEVSLEEDLRRRDLRINAMAIDAKGELQDPYEGLCDLQQGLLRHVSQAFREDPVRLLRVARFAARFPSFQIHPETMTLMREMVQVGETDHWTAERVWRELDQGMAEIKPSALWRCLADCKLKPFDRLSEEEEPMLAQLDLAAADGAKRGLTWGIFCALTHEQFREPVLASLKMPRETQALCHQVRKHQSSLLDILFDDPYTPDQHGDSMAGLPPLSDEVRAAQAQSIAGFFESIDLMRRPQQLHDLLAVIRWHPAVQSQASLRSKRAIEALNVLAEDYRHAKLNVSESQRRLKGPALGEAIRLARALELSKALRTRYPRGLHNTRP